ncbi:MAG: endonuclease domain-containing protein [Sphingobacteriales bacterium]|jgi:very-short-patch-repair endonuclease
MLQILTYSIRTKMSEAETMLWRELLKDKKMLGYCFNRRIELHDHHAAFLCLELRLIIEIDNTRSSKHENRLRLEKELFFRQRGYYVLRFFENEILSEMEKVRSIIKEWILFNAA